MTSHILKCGQRVEKVDAEIDRFFSELVSHACSKFVFGGTETAC